MARTKCQYCDNKHICHVPQLPTVEGLQQILRMLKRKADWDADHTQYWDKETRAYERGRSAMAEALLLMIDLDELTPEKIKEILGPPE